MNSLSKLLLDQMFDRQVLATLRQETQDVISVAEIGLATADDAELIGVAITCIDEGITSKMLLDRAISERSGVSRVTALNLLERYTGDDPVLHRWQFKRGVHGRQEYSLLVSAPDNGPPVTSREHDDLC